MSEESKRQATLKGFDDFDAVLGDELRGERATLGKSLLDVQRDLRIKAAYIAAIENCDPSVFPNPGFVAGYVRSYARYLKLDPDALFSRFCAESGFEGVNASMIPAKKKNKKPLSPTGSSSEIASSFSGYNSLHNESFLNMVSPSGIASVAVLGLLVTVLGYGGWSVLKDIQRVEFSPVDQTPIVAADVAQAEFELNTEVNDVLNTARASRGIVEGSEADLLGRLYRAQELSVPKLEPRDGPIAAIDPDTVGLLKPKEIPTIVEPITSAQEPESDVFPIGPVVALEEVAPTVEIYASRAAWVRVYLEDGTVLFEKILEKGEAYRVPENAEGPLLRAGNSGSVYVLVDQVAYGPVGKGTSVAKQVSLASLSVTDEFELASDLDIVPVSESSLNTAENQ